MHYDWFVQNSDDTEAPFQQKSELLKMHEHQHHAG